MVNVGGPSKGCITCIRRKIRCDRQQPHCRKCINSKRKCEGYRNAADIMFRDQSHAVATRVKAVQKDQDAQSTYGDSSRKSSTSRSSVEAEAVHTTREGSPMNRSPKLDQERGLIDFFANNFTCSGTVEIRNNLFWIPYDIDEFLKDESTKLSLQCTGAMALARLRKSPEYLREAQKRYGSALLSLAEKKLRSPEITGPSVFMTVLLLGFFEVLASYDSSSRQSWKTHLNALGTLYKQYEHHTVIDPRMFRQTRSQILIGALQCHTPVPEPFTKRGPTGSDPKLPDFRLFDDVDVLLVRLAGCLAQRRTAGASSALLGALKALAEDLVQWKRDLPPMWAFSMQPCEWTTRWWWDVRCDVYSSGFIAHTWNKVRAAQIVTYDLIQETTSSLTWLGGDALAMTTDQVTQESPPPEVRNMVTDICATIPPYYRPSSEAARPYEYSSPPLIGTTFWFLWVLEVVGNMKEAPPELKEWIVQCFERMYEVTGIIKARLVAEKLMGGYTGPVLG